MLLFLLLLFIIIVVVLLLRWGSVSFPWPGACQRLRPGPVRSCSLPSTCSRAISSYCRSCCVLSVLDYPLPRPVVVGSIRVYRDSRRRHHRRLLCCCCCCTYYNHFLILLHSLRAAFSQNPRDPSSAAVVVSYILSFLGAVVPSHSSHHKQKQQQPKSNTIFANGRFCQKGRGANSVQVSSTCQSPLFAKDTVITCSEFTPDYGD